MEVTAPISPDSVSPDTIEATSSARLWELLNEPTEATVHSVCPVALPPPTLRVAAPNPSLGDQLAILADLYREGLLTGMEFCVAKTIMLGDIPFRQAALEHATAARSATAIGFAAYG